jgi:N-acetylneuraminic acid mutarotase
MTRRSALGGFALRSAVALAAVLALSAGNALAAGPSPAAITWTEGTPLPSGATRFDGAVVGGKMYVLGFREADQTSTTGEVWYYDIAGDTWVDTGVAMPVPVSNYEASVLKDPTGRGIYIFGGRDATGAIIDTVQVYYPSTNTTAVIDTDPFPGQTPSQCVSLPGMGVAVVKNKAYVLGGMSFSSSVPACIDDNSAEVWRFDPMAAAGNKWTSEPPLPTARGYIIAAVVGKTIYAIGGDVNSAGTLTAQTAVDSWTVGDATWDATTADLPEPCDESQAFGFKKGKLAKTITVTGCGQFPVAVADVLQYDLTTDTWSTNSVLNEARRNEAAANIGSKKKPKLFVVGGYNSDSTVVLPSSEVGKP